jgi:transcriptional regulator with XRE-family HTH domain
MKENKGLKMNTILDDYMKNPQFKRLMSQEELIMEVTETLCELLEKEKVSRKELANRLGKSKGFVSQLLNGGRNLTLRTVADILYALGYKVSLKPYKEEGERQKAKIIEFPTWQTHLKKPLMRWEPGEVSCPEDYFCDNAAVSR